MKNVVLWVVAAVGASGLLACRSGGGTDSAGATTAVAELKDSNGASFGRVKFTEKMQGIVSIELMIDAKSSTTATEGDHAVHIHQNGECTPPAFTSAGPHFNPTAMKHGSPEGSGHHAGDLGNLEIDGDRTGKKDINSSEMTLVADQPATIVGRTVIVHAKKDDYVTQDPPGNAGGRIACGVITRE